MAITIEILNIEIIEDEDGNPQSQHAEITISDGVDIYAWRRGGIPLAADVQASLEAEAARLWAAAQARAEPIELYRHVTLWRLLKAFALVVLDEINILRAAAGLGPRSASQIEGAIKNKLKE